MGSNILRHPKNVRFSAITQKKKKKMLEQKLFHTDPHSAWKRTSKMNFKNKKYAYWTSKKTNEHNKLLQNGR